MAGSVAGPNPRVLDIEAKQRELDATPLFMRSLPSDGSSNVELDALQNLIFDEEPNVAALNFKGVGNDYFKEKRYREALHFYTQGIKLKPDDNALLEALLCNRAACNLELQNFGSAIRDCGRAFGINSHSTKALYRSAKALLQLDRFDEALDACNRCLEIDNTNVATQQLAAQIHETLAEREAIKNEKERKAKQKQEEDNLLKIACTARYLTFSRTPSGNMLGVPHFDLDGPHPFTPTSQIIFPVFLLYPQYNSSDLIKSFAEHTTFQDQLEMVFPESGPPANWDVNREYRVGNLSVYAVTRKKGLLKVGLRMTLADVFLRTGATKFSSPSPSAGIERAADTDGLELKDGCLSFVVVPRGNVEQGYLETFKANRDAQK